MQNKMQVRISLYVIVISIVLLCSHSSFSQDSKENCHYGVIDSLAYTVSCSVNNNTLIFDLSLKNMSTDTLYFQTSHWIILNNVDSLMRADYSFGELASFGPGLINSVTLKKIYSNDEHRLSAMSNWDLGGYLPYLKIICPNEALYFGQNTVAFHNNIMEKEPYKCEFTISYFPYMAFKSYELKDPDLSAKMLQKMNSLKTFHFTGQDSIKIQFSDKNLIKLDSTMEDYLRFRTDWKSITITDTIPFNK